MTDSERINFFLRQVRSRALLETGIRVGGYAFAILVSAFLGLALAAALAGPAVSWPYVACGTIVAFVAGGLALGVVRPARVLDQSAAVARLVGKHRPALASDLLSAVQLQDMPAVEAEISAEMTSAFFATVAEATQPIATEDLIPLDHAIRAVVVAAFSLLVLLIAMVAFPHAVGRGMRTLFHTPTLFEGAQVVRDPLVGDVRLAFDFPAYTGLSRQIIEGSTGDIHALRGTRVQIEMRPLRSARQARLLLGENGEGGSIVANLNHGKLSATLALDDNGSYRVWLLPFLGRPMREDRAHRIVVENDQPPEVDIVGPADRMELPTPRPVEVAYHARDDFGLSDIALVYRVNDGPEQRILLKNAQGMREVRATTTFEPASAMLTPGAHVAYHIEAKDRDEVSGSKTGTSRTLTLVIQNPREDIEEYLAREHEVLEKMIGVLADRIEFESKAAELPPARLREVHDGEAAGLLVLGRLVEHQRRAGGTNKILASTLGTVAAHLGKYLHEEDELLAADKGGNSSALWARIHAAAPRHIAELEAAVLALDDLIGRQRLDDLASIGKELVAAHQRLQDLLERYKATGDEQLRRQIEREVRELRDRIAELAHKIAEVKARNEVSPDWMNMPDAHKAMEQAARLDSLLAKGDARALGDALSELGDSLSSLRDMLDKNAGDFSNTRFPQESRALAELARKISDLEGDQRSLAADGRSLAKEVDGELSRWIEAGQADFLAKAKQKLDQIQHKIAGSLPRELGNLGETTVGSVREEVRQLRRLLPAKEWSEARREVERMADGLGHLQHLAERQIAFSRPPSPNLLSFDGQVDEAAGLARELSADLAHMLPRGGEVMSPEQRARTENLGQRQASIEEKTRGLSHELGGKGESVPGAEGTASELEEIAGQMRQAGEDLQQGSAHEGAGRADEVAQRLAKLRQDMGQKPNAGSRESREPVRIPEADATKAPREWRQELMEAMREKAPEKFRDEVRRYYEELVR
jgi:phage shock protein A